MRTLYSILGVPENADLATITKAYRALMKQHHPDINQQADLRLCQEINRVYSILKDPQQRARYDAWLVRQRPPRRPVVVYSSWSSSSTSTSTGTCFNPGSFVFFRF